MVVKPEMKAAVLIFPGYSRRRHDLDDSDNASYAPDFFGLQCPPPYEDPPPPYSPPKPEHHHRRDQPPPYDAIDDNGNIEIGLVDDNGNQTGNRTQNQSGVTGSAGNHSNSGQGQHQNGQMTLQGNVFNFSAVHDLIDPRNMTGRCADRNTSNFSTDITNVITSDSIQNQPYSFIQARTAPRAEIRNERNRNQQISNNRQAVSDIGESTSSSDSEASRNSSPVPTEYDSRTLALTNAGNHPLSNRDSGVVLSQDAETTVKQFLDKQFGQMAKNRNRNFPNSMSQSWTCSEQASNAPHLGLAGTVNRNSGFFQQVPKGVSGLARETDSENLQTNAPKVGIRCGKCNNIIACKCNKMKTNGLLTRSHSDYTQNATNSGPNANRVASKSRNVQLLPGSFGARVSYVEPEDTCSDTINKPVNQNSSSQYHSDSETNISYFTPDTDRMSPNVSQCDDCEVPSSSRRQKVLRELRLSHLLFSPNRKTDNVSCPDSPIHGGVNNGLEPQKIKNIQSPTSAFSVCSERRKKQNTSQRPLSDVISNDAQYPEAPFDFVRTLKQSAAYGNETQGRNPKHSGLDPRKSGLNVSTTTLQSLDRMTMMSEEDNTRQNGRNNSKQLAKGINKKQNNSVKVESTDNGLRDTSFKDLNFNINSQIGVASVNTDKSAIKLCNDKDVSRFIAAGIPPHLNVMTTTGLPSGVPSVSDRANASQFYNFEQEDKTPKKSKKKQSYKRHSRSSFPEERPLSSRNCESGRKNSPRQKGVSLKSKQLRQFNVGDNDHSSSDDASNTNLVPRRQYFQTIDNHRPSPVKTGFLPISSAISPTKHQSSSKTLQAIVDTENNSPVYFQDSPRVSSNLNHVGLSPIHSSYMSSTIGAKVTPKSSCHSDSRSQSLHGKKIHKRSRSLGKDECYVGVHVGNKHVDKQPSQKSSSRRKKNRQSFPGTNAFHRELEHVLESQKQAMSFSPGKAVGQHRSGEHQLHAVTQV